MTAIVLYPNEEGRMQSKFEDFWVRVDDYQKLVLSRHTVFMAQVANLEAAFLDRVFGDKLVSIRSIAVSCCCSVASFALAILLLEAADASNRQLSISWLVGTLTVVALFILYVLLPYQCGIRDAILFSSLPIILGWIVLSNPVWLFEENVVTFLTFVVAGFCCDVIFIAATRRLLRLAGEMTRSIRIVGLLILNLALAVALVFPILLPFVLRSGYDVVFTSRWFDMISMAVGLSNLFESLLALLFVVLAALLLVHRALWPLLNRTLFRMQDVGTTGRRAILMTVGLSLMGLSGWKVPGLFNELVRTLGK
jgi:hypothetical protein